MNRVQWSISTISTAIALCFVAAGCGGSDGGSPSATTTATVATTQTAPIETGSTPTSTVSAASTTVASGPIVFEGNTDLIFEFVVLDDGRVITASFDGKIRLWDPIRPDEPPVVFPEEPGPARLLADGRIALNRDADLTEIIDPTEPGAELVVLPIEIAPTGRIELLRDDLVLIANSNTAASIWDPNQPDADPIEIEVVFDGIDRLGDGRLALWTEQGTVTVVSPEQPATVVEFQAHDTVLRSALGLSDGRLITTADGGEVRVWDLDTPDSPRFEYRGHTSTVWGLDELADGRVVSASDDGTVQIWDPDGAGDDVVLRGHVDFVTESLALRDGRVASAGSDMVVRVWDPAEPSAEPLERRGHQGWITFLAELPDGRLVSAAEDFTVRVWDIDTG